MVAKGESKVVVHVARARGCRLLGNRKSKGQGCRRRDRNGIVARVGARVGMLEGSIQGSIGLYRLAHFEVFKLEKHVDNKKK